MTRSCWFFPNSIWTSLRTFQIRHIRKTLLDCLMSFHHFVAGVQHASETKCSFSAMLCVNTSQTRKVNNCFGQSGRPRLISPCFQVIRIFFDESKLMWWQGKIPRQCVKYSLPVDFWRASRIPSRTTAFRAHLRSCWLVRWQVHDWKTWVLYGSAEKVTYMWRILFPQVLEKSGWWFRRVGNAHEELCVSTLPRHRWLICKNEALYSYPVPNITPWRALLKQSFTTWASHQKRQRQP